MAVQTLVLNPAPESIISSYNVTDENNILDANALTSVKSSSTYGVNGDIELQFKQAPFVGNEEILEVRIRQRAGISGGFSSSNKYYLYSGSTRYYILGDTYGYPSTTQYVTLVMNPNGKHLHWETTGGTGQDYTDPWGIYEDYSTGTPVEFASPSTWMNGIHMLYGLSNPGQGNTYAFLTHIIIEIDYIPSNVVDVKHSGVWKESTPFTKHSGVWKEATPSAKQSGTWKEST